MPLSRSARTSGSPPDRGGATSVGTGRGALGQGASTSRSSARARPSCRESPSSSSRNATDRLSDHVLFGEGLDLPERHPEQLAVHVVVALATTGRAVAPLTPRVGPAPPSTRKEANAGRDRSAICCAGEDRKSTRLNS